MKLSFSEALERINEERYVSRDEVSARALRMFVWIAEWHIPCCMSESQAYCLTKRDAIESACDMANTGSDGESPRGMRTALRKTGRFDSDSPLFGRVINTVKRVRLRDLF
jgi:hypothetical protein